MALGPLIILSGPSGSGKSTVIAKLLASGDLPMRLSVSATTRKPRPGEEDGRHYHFWTRERFLKELAAGAFLEHAEVHGQYYGTLRTEVQPYREQGIGVILDIDVQGAALIRKQFPDCETIFLLTSSLDDYELRLRRRGTEDEATIQRRLATARRELELADTYHYQLVNDDLDAAVTQLRDIVTRLLPREKHAR